jgi:glucose-1-phosphate adenylyltransferase
MIFQGSSLLRDTVTMILAGGQGERLRPLTEPRSKPSVPFGGKYRIIDFALSNCLNSGLRKIYILTQYKSDSLNSHIYEAWNIFNPDLGEFIHSVPPQLKQGQDWYKGTANAIQQNMNLFHNGKFKRVLILSGDHIYKMDYLKMLQSNAQKDADLTIASIVFPKDQATRFGILGVNENYDVVSFIEKPKDPPEIPNKPGYCFASMGIYVFKADVLKNVLLEMEAAHLPNDDFGKHVIPYMISAGYKVSAWMFEDENKKEQPYWMDIGTLESYYAANMDLLNVIPMFNLYDQDWPIWTKQLQLPPAKTISHEGERVGRTFNSLVCDGTIVSGGLVERSIIGPGCRVNSYTYIVDTILFNNVNIGRHARIRRCIIDKNVNIPEGMEIGFDPDIDKKRFTVTESGLVVIPKGYQFE